MLLSTIKLAILALLISDSEYSVLSHNMGSLQSSPLATDYDYRGVSGGYISQELLQKLQQGKYGQSGVGISGQVLADQSQPNVVHTNGQQPSMIPSGGQQPSMIPSGGQQPSMIPNGGQQQNMQGSISQQVIVPLKTQYSQAPFVCFPNGFCQPTTNVGQITGWGQTGIPPFGKTNLGGSLSSGGLGNLGGLTRPVVPGISSTGQLITTGKGGMLTVPSTGTGLGHGGSTHFQPSRPTTNGQFVGIGPQRKGQIWPFQIGSQPGMGQRQPITGGGGYVQPIYPGKGQLWPTSLGTQFGMGQLQTTQIGGQVQPIQTGGQVQPIQKGGQVQPIQRGGQVQPIQTGGQGGQVLPTHKGGQVLPTHTGGQVLPTHTGGQVLPTHTGGQVLPTHTGGQVLPTHTGGQVLPTHTGGQVLPTHTGGQVLPTHTGGQVLPTHTGGQVLPTHIGGQVQPTHTGGQLQPVYPGSQIGKGYPKPIYPGSQIGSGHLRPVYPGSQFGKGQLQPVYPGSHIGKGQLQPVYPGSQIGQGHPIRIPPKQIPSPIFPNGNIRPTSCLLPNRKPFPGQKLPQFFHRLYPSIPICDITRRDQNPPKSLY